MLSVFVERDVETEASVEAAATYGYWLSLRPEGATMPRWRDFDWMQIPLYMICCCGVVDVVGGDDEFVYRFWGTQHMSMHRQEMTNRSIHEMRPSAVRDVILDQYRIVRDAGPASAIHLDIPEPHGVDSCAGIFTASAVFR
jgi:hypothetical protein